MGDSEIHRLIAMIAPTGGTPGSGVRYVQELASASQPRMLDLSEELYQLVRALDDARVDYALCGGLALAVHGKVRATIDIDLLVERDALQTVKERCRSRGFSIEADPMRLAGGDVVIERLSTVIDNEVVSVDLLVVTDATRGAWNSRIAVPWRGMELWVVSRGGLVALKQLRRSGQDLDDIAWLEQNDGD